MKTKMLEARFHEEKLRLQQKHDSAVQKVKNKTYSHLDLSRAEFELCGQLYCDL